MKRTSIDLIYPVSAIITPKVGEYGAPRRHRKPHAGVDFYVGVGKPVKAVADGVVERASEVKPNSPKEVTYGHVIVIYHGKNFHTGKHTYTLYGHLKEGSYNLKPGDKVERGDVIARSGNSGNVGAHLHFEAIEAPERITWNREGRDIGLPYGKYRVHPQYFLDKPFFKVPDLLTDEEMDKFYAMITTDFRTTPRPTFLVGIPEYREVIKKLRGEYPSIDEKPPKVTLKFKNMFSSAFRAFFPSVELQVNGKSLGTTQTGEKVYELNVWG